MKKEWISRWVAVVALLPFVGHGEASGLNIIPKPVSATVGTGVFKIDAATQISIHPDDAETRRIAGFLAERIKTNAALDLEIISSASSRRVNAIMLEKQSNPELGGEGYVLQVDEDRIALRGDAAGLFYGIQTLLQLLPPEVYGAEQSAGLAWEIPAANVVDQPRFEWRGMHLDVARHIYPVAFIKEYIDLLAMHKLNVFHWHLVDDQGWRIEIKKHPLLTEKSAWREGTDQDAWDHLVGPAVEGLPQYGGFYTQEDIREIVAYAAERFITVVPEIEMPGHARSALDVYPHLYCTGKPYQRKQGLGIALMDPFCAGNDESFEFLENILAEVIALFPSEYIHVGADEVSKKQWGKCPKCRQRMESEGLANMDELQAYFMARIEKFVHSKGRKIMGWDEILEGGLGPDAAVMSWRERERAVASAKAGHATVMSPKTHCYFDYPHTQGRLPVERVYSFEPVPSELNAEEAKNILGAQGNVWTEHMPTPKQVEYMALPRMSALAEVVWSNKKDRDYADFLQRLEKQYKRFDALGVDYFGCKDGTATE